MRGVLVALALAALGGTAHAQVGTPLDCGVPQDGQIASGGPAVVYTFDVAEANDAIAVRVMRTSADTRFVPAYSLSDPFGTALAPRRPTLFSQAGSGDEFNLTAAGTYTLTVAAREPNPGGTFRVVRIRLKGPCRSTALACGAPAKGHMAAALQVDSYQFDGSQGDIYSVRLAKTTPDPTEDDRATAFAVAVYDPNGSLQGTVDNLAAGGVTTGVIRMDVRLAASGRQTIVVFEASTGARTGLYSVAVARLNGPCRSKAAACGAALQSTLAEPLTLDTYTIAARAGDQYVLRRAAVDAASSLRPLIEVYDPAGRTVAPASSGDASRYGFTAPVPGNYTVLVGDDLRYGGIQTGAYAISFVRLNEPCNAQPLECGGAADGRIDGPMQLTVYSVQADAGDVYLVRLMRTDAGGYLMPRLDIWDARGNSVGMITTTDLNRITFRAPAAGVYTMMVSDGQDGARTGGYAISLARLNRPCNATPLGCASLAAGSIAGPLRFATYSYNAGAGDAFTARMLNPGNTLQEGLEVYDPQGNPAGTPVSGNYPVVDVTRASPGVYTILALDNGRSPGVGPFAVQLYRTKGACVPAAAQGVTLRGLVTGQAPFTAYAITAVAGDLLAVRSASFSRDLTANMELFDPEGVRLATGTFSLGATVQATGNHTLIVGPSSSRTAGSYALSWQALNRPVGAEALQCGRTTPGSLVPATQFRYYTAPAGAGDVLRLLLTRASDNFNPQMELFDPAGRRLAGTSPDITRTAAATGSYLVLVSPSTANGETGNYALALQKPNSPCAATVLVCGQTLLRSVDAPGQMDAYIMPGSADRSVLRVPGRFGTFSPYMELYDQLGTLLQSGATEQITRSLPESGLYTLLVRDRFGVNTGTYRASLQHDPNACPQEDRDAPVVSLLRPTGGEVVAGGQSFRIAWHSDDNVDVVAQEVRLSTDGGATFPAVIASGLGGTAQSFVWQTPTGLKPTRAAKIRVTAADAAGNTASATSDLLSLIGAGFSENESVIYEYDGLNRITKATYSDGTAVVYTYDAVGNLVNVNVTKP